MSKGDRIVCDKMKIFAPKKRVKKAKRSIAEYFEATRLVLSRLDRCHDPASFPSVDRLAIIITNRETDK